MNIRLRDSNFAHAYTIGNGDLKIIPKYFKWDRSNNKQDITFFTDRHLQEIKNIENKSNINIAAIFEPPTINNNSYEYILNNKKDYTIVLTYNREFLKDKQHFQFVPHAGCWIEKKNQKTYKKNKNLSVIFSDKSTTDGHKLRHKVINNFKNKIDFIAGKGYNKIENKLEALKEFRYQIVIENCNMDYYFTEKLIDCFITGTVPIYWGCPSIGKFFDLDGMFHFRNMTELKEILNMISEDDYNNKMKYIKENFEEAKKYTIIEDWIFSNVISELI